MQWATLDIIVRRWLLERGLPLHYYAEGMFHAASCVRELSFDTLQIVNTKRLPVNDYYAVDLPSDFVDDVAVAIPAGNLLQQVAKANNLNPLKITNSSGSYIPYSEVSSDNTETFFGLGLGWSWFFNFNDYGEPTGRFFGAGGGAKSNGYQVFKERSQIQLTETFTSDEIVLMYISNGQSADNASKIDWQAVATIQAYMDWKRGSHSAIERSPEGLTFYNQKRLLRSRLNPLTPTDIKNVLRENYRATIKS